MSTIAPPRPSSNRNGRARCPSRPTAGRLGAYTDNCGNRRELVCLAENARTVCDMYLAAAHRRPCRPLTPEDFQVEFGEGASIPATARADTREVRNNTRPDAELVDRYGSTYRLEPGEASLSIPELRWRRYVPERQGERPEIVSLREVIGALESYEPALKLTLSAIERHGHDPHVSVALLRAEHERATASPIVLNRGLREAVLELLARGEVSIGEIAIRCGRVKHGPRGTVSGETSWLARRIGQLPEGGRTEPTPWVHTDVLALIARQGLHVSPREVEV
jgi:hypothetical protein